MGYYDAIIFIFGVAFLASAWLPSRLTRTPLSLPMIWLGVGLFMSFLDVDLPDVNPLKNSELTEHLTELVIIIALIGAGLKLDRPLNWSNWYDTWRLLGITMPLCIGFMMLLSMYLLNLPLPVALLLGALIAPTDPVLASDVQVGPPSKGGEHDVRFALTSEAGLNDGLAFPFVKLALVLGIYSFTQHPLMQWLALDVLWGIIAGILGGALVGYVTAKIILKPEREMEVRDGFIAIALTFLAYGATQLTYGYGFLGVFVAAHVFRHYEHDHKFHNTLYNFTDQVERLIIPLLLVLMAVFIYQGIFFNLSWYEVVLSLSFLCIIRPLSGMIGLIGSHTSLYHKLIISIFGIRGIGSFYYLAYALNKSEYFKPYGEQLWRITVLIVLISIVFHGMSASIVFQRLIHANKNLSPPN